MTADSHTGSTRTPRQNFLVLGSNMTWQLAIVVLVPIIGGALLDKALGWSPVLTIIGFVVAMIGTALVMRYTIQVASKLPVPKMTKADRERLKKMNEEDDD